MAVHNAPDYATSNFKSLARRLYAMAGVGAGDIDVVQSYENFTGGVIMALVEHGFCEPEAVNELFVPETLPAPGGRLPLNTHGGTPPSAALPRLAHNHDAVRQAP